MKEMNEQESNKPETVRKCNHTEINHNGKVRSSNIVRNGHKICIMCGLTVRTSHYACESYWQKRAFIRHIPNKFEDFARRRGINNYDLLPIERRRIEEEIDKAYEIDPKPNLNILTYKICKRLNIEIDETLLKIPKSKVPHIRCNKIFEALGWE